MARCRAAIFSEIQSATTMTVDSSETLVSGESNGPDLPVSTSRDRTLLWLVSYERRCTTEPVVKPAGCSTDC